MKTAKLLHFGMRGHTLHASHEHCQGYEDPESFCQPYHWWTHPPDQMSYHWHSYEIPAEGIPVVDVRAAVDTPEGYAWVFKGPLVNVDLDDGETDPCPMPSELFADAMVGTEYGTLLAHHVISQRTQKRGSLDGVSVSEYVQGWKDHGANIGRFYVNPDGKSGRIEWTHLVQPREAVA